jgi:segregation and condensation protein A|tara:strand:- start:3954 stop:4781 length:828 start_codon:yes stop_codon:yes gene_type:complete
MAATEELFLRQKEHAVKLPSFEGPLDLLLFLIRRNEIDIYDIPIEKVLIQYLDALHSMDDLKPEVAGEFFVMAATLMQIKSRLLLPKERRPIEAVEDGAEEEMIDPRWELVQQLLTYRKFKDAALELDELIEAASHALPRLVAEDPSLKRPRPLKSSDRLEIWNAFNAVLRRLSERISVGEIDDEIITVAECMELILKRLNTEERFTFTQLYADEAPRSQSHLISNFLAILELTRLSHLRIEQNENFTDIVCTRVEEDERLALAKAEQAEDLAQD